MPSYDVNIPGSGTYRVNSPVDLSEQQVWAALQQQLAASSNPLAGKTTAELEGAKSAPFSVSDVITSGAESLVGSLKSLSDVFGAGSDLSNWLGKERQRVAEVYTPERKAEKAREAELTRRAAESGSTLEEIKQFGKTVLSSPIQSITSGLASSIPAIAAGFAALPASAPASLAAGVAVLSRSLFGAAQGVGEAKGSMYDQAFEVYKKQGKSDEEAAKLAEASQAYVAANLPLFLGSAGLGALDAATGVESTANKALVRAFSEQAGKRALTREGVEEAFKQLPQRAAKAPTYLKEAGKGFLEEGGVEGLQGGYGQFLQNVAATRAGEETPYMQGVLGSAVQEGLVGGLTGTAMSPLQMGVKRGEYVADQFLRQQKAFFDAQDQAMADMQEKQRQRTETEQRLGVSQEGKMLALPAPDKRVTEQEDPLAGLKNPVGNIEKSELSPKIVKYVNDYRKANGLPALKSYSIEDIKDAMPGVDPVGEQADLARIIAAKTGFTGQQTYTPEDVLNVAGSKNIDTGTPGFSAFLERATGESDLAQMTQPQLYSAFKALDAVPASAAPQILPVDTNASRFKQAQYDAAVQRVNESVSQQPASRATVISDIKDATGLTEDRDAEAILNTALREGVLEENLKPAFQVSDAEGKVVGMFEKEQDAKKAAAKKGYSVQKTSTREIAAPTQAAPEKVRTPLPAGYEIEETEAVTGTEPAGFQVLPEGRNKPLVTENTLEEARAKVERLQGLRQKAAEGFLQNIERDRKTIANGRAALERMEAAGQSDTEAYKVAKAKQDRSERILSQRIERMLDRIEEYTAPLKTRPSGQRQVTRKGFTVKKEGKEVGTFPTRLEAEGSVLAQLSDEELATLASDTRYGGIADRARVEQERRASPEKGIRVFKSPITPEVRDEAAEALEKSLMPLLKKLGLMDVGLKVVKAIKNDADGSYAGKLIQIALDAKNPITTLRHEAIHALKELGFFTPSQWSVLERKAKDEWINKYLAGKNAVYEGETMSRLDAYKRMGLSDADIMEEAIADAFADFSQTKAPSGLMAALMKRLNGFFEALKNAFKGLGFTTASDVFSQVERGELKPTTVPEATAAQVKASLRPSEQNAWRATPEELEQAVDMYKEDGILPYVSTGRLDLPTTPEKFSLQSYDPDKHLSFDPTLGVPINKDGTVTVYYHTTKDRAMQIKNTKVIPADGKDRIYLTNESGGADVLRNKGNFDQVLDGSTVLVYVKPEMLQVDMSHDNGRVDFFVPVAQGEFFNKKMKLQSIQKGRNEAIAAEFSYEDHAKKISDAVAKYKDADGAARRKMVADARKLLKREHNVGSLLSENGKLEKTRIGDYGLEYDGNPVASQGLGLASAQKLSEKISTCPRSAICEGLCLGETSGGNFMFGGAATEDVGDIQKSSFRAAARMMQYLKTEALVINPEAFTILLQSEIDSLKNWAASETQRRRNPETKKFFNEKKDIYAPAVRLNVTSDFKPEMFRAVIEGNPDVMFYDYTKLGSETIAPNHHLTYSSTGFGQIVDGEKVFFKNKAGNYDHNWATMRKRLDDGSNVAMAFSSKSALPKFVKDEETGKSYRVLDGDLYDARFLDEVNPAKLEQGGTGVIVGLRNKAGNLSEKNATKKTGGFFVQYNPKDGDTVVAPDQAQFKQLGKTFPIAAEKFNLEEAPEEKYSLKTVDDVINDGVDRLVESARKHRLNTLEDRYMVGLARADSSLTKIQNGIEKRLLDLGVSNVRDSEGNKEIDSIIYDKVLPRVRAELKKTAKYSLKEAPDTPEFKQWFGQSKIVDADGKPMQYYHGTAADITEFKPGTANAIFFSPRPVFSEAFATEAKERLRDQAFQAMDRDKRVAIIKEEADKALASGDITQQEHKDILAKAKRYAPTIKTLPYQIEGQILDNLENYLLTREVMYPVYIRSENPFDYENQSHVDKVYAWMMNHSSELGKKDNPERFLSQIKGAIESGRPGTIEMNMVQEAVRALGFDAFYVKESGIKNIAVYSPTQVVSSIGNIGTYGVGKVTAERAKAFGMTPDEATRAQERGDIRLSLRDSLPTDLRDAIDITTHSAPRDDGWISRITSAKNNFDYVTFRDKLRANLLNRYQRFSTYKTELERRTNAQILADSSAEAAALQADDASGVAASVLGVYDRQGGIPVYKNGFTSVWNDNGKIKGPAVIFAPLAKYGDPYIYQMFQFWAGVQRGKRLMLEGREKLFTRDDIARAEQLEKKYPEFKEIFKEWNSFNKGLVQYMVDTGVVSPENAEIWTRDADYLPFYRALDDDQTIGPKVYQSMAGVTGPKKLKGGSAQLADFLETIVRNTQSAVHAGMRNVAANRAIGEAKALGMATKVGPGEPISGDHVIKIMEQGKPSYYNVADPLFINAMKSLNMPEIPFMSVLSAPANFLRSWVTKDPGFILANLMRDSMSAWVTSGEPITPIIDTFKEFGAEVSKRSPELEALMNAGVVGGYDYAKGVKQSGELFRKELQRRYGPPEPGMFPLKAAKSVWEGLEKLTEASDAATRIAVYKQVMAETGNEAEAIFRAKEIMNFNRKGSNPVIRVLTAAVPFLNARMQGLDVLYRAGVSPTILKLAGQGVPAQQEALQKVFIARGLTIAALSIMYALAVSGDDEYEKQEEETKDNNWIVPGVGLKIPTPFEVGFLFKTVPERFVRAYVNGDDTHQDFIDAMKRGVINTFAFNPVPQAIKPLAEAAVNYNTFTLRPIVGQGMADVAPEYQVGPSTSKVAEILGAATGLSPLKLDHIYKGYTGTMGTYLSDLIDTGLNQFSDAPKASKRFEQMPVIKRFMADPEARGNITTYYKLKDEVDIAVRTSNFLLETAKPEEFEKYLTDNATLLMSKDFVRQIDKDMKEIRKMRTMIQSSQMDPDEKRDTLTAVGQIENALTQNSKTIKRMIQESK